MDRTPQRVRDRGTQYDPSAASRAISTNGSSQRDAASRTGANCFNTGYRGRAAVYEVLTVDNALRSLIRQEASVEEIIEQARAGGMKLLYEAGILRVLEGVTTFEEVRRVLSEAQ